MKNPALKIQLIVKSPVAQLIGSQKIITLLKDDGAALFSPAEKHNARKVDARNLI